MRNVLCVLALLVLLGVFPLAAQEITMVQPGEENSTGGTYCYMGYTQQDVNALWHIVGPRWREALAHPRNEAVQEASREFTKGGTLYYKMSIGECLFVPPGMKARVPLMADPSTNKESPTVSEGGAGQQQAGAALTPWWVPFMLLAIFALFIAAVMLITWQRNKERKVMLEQRDWERNNPAVSGPPIIEGGMDTIPATDQIRIATERLQEVAAQTFVPNSKPREYRVIGEIVRGVLNGTGMTQYDGIKPQERVFTDTPAFQALMEHIPTGQRIHRFVLWACANGAWSGMMGGDGLTFTPNVDQNKLQIRLMPPLLSATTDDVLKYGEPEYDPRHDVVGVGLLREEAVANVLSQVPNRRDRVFMNGNGY